MITDEEAKKRICSGTTNRPEQLVILYNDGRRVLAKWPDGSNGSAPFRS